MVCVDPRVNQIRLWDRGSSNLIEAGASQYCSLSCQKPRDSSSTPSFSAVFVLLTKCITVYVDCQITCVVVSLSSSGAYKQTTCSTSRLLVIKPPHNHLLVQTIELLKFSLCWGVAYPVSPCKSCLYQHRDKIQTRHRPPGFLIIHLQPLDRIFLS